MKKITAIIPRNLSTTVFLLVYLGFVISHLVSDSFILENQIGLIIAMFPFILLGMTLDFLLRRNKELDLWMRVVAQLLPLGIFAMQIVSTIYLYLGKEPIEFFNYLIWLFISAPFFIISYKKDEFRPKLLRTSIGTGAIIVVYLFLMTQTKELNNSYGSFIYFVSYFFMIYVSSGIRRFPYLGAILGICNAFMLLLLRYTPMSANAKNISWDYHISIQIEMLLFVTILFSILIRLYEAMKSKNVNPTMK